MSVTFPLPYPYRPPPGASPTQIALRVPRMRKMAVELNWIDPEHHELGLVDPDHPFVTELCGRRRVGWARVGGVSYIFADYYREDDAAAELGWYIHLGNAAFVVGKRLYVYFKLGPGSGSGSEGE